jgi:hypothetical protein
MSGDFTQAVASPRTPVPSRRRRARAIGTVAATVVALLGVGVGSGPAHAAAPANDDIRHATPIASLPASFTVDTSDATSSAADGRCVGGASVWYRFRPTTTARLALTDLGSDHDTLLAVFTGRRGDRQLLKCRDDSVGFSEAMRLRAAAGTTYWIAVSSCCDRRAPGGAVELRAARSFPRVQGSVEVTGAQAGALSGSLEISGTVTCSSSAVLQLELRARQRVGANVARGYAEDYGFTTCTPGAVPTPWHLSVDSDTGWAFQAGTQVVIDGSSNLTNGFFNVVGPVQATPMVTDAPALRAHVGRR